MAKILLTEDEPDQVSMIRIRLESSGFQVLTASNAVDGIKLAQEEKPDLILMDMILPGMHGLDATIKLKEVKETRGIPIIAITAMNTPGFRQECYKVGICDFIRKPYESAELICKIKENMRKKKEAKKVLVINDNSDFASSIKAGLNIYGYQVITAIKPAEGVRKAQKERPDLIILNIAMLNGKGYEVFFDLKKSPSTISIPIVFISSLLPPKELEEKALILDAVDFIPNTFGHDEIIAKIKRILGE